MLKKNKKMNKSEKNKKSLLNKLVTQFIILIFIMGMVPLNAAALPDLKPTCSLMASSNEVETVLVLTATSTDFFENAGIKSIKIYEDGNILSTKSCYGYTSCVYTKTVIYSSPGTHEYYAIAKDNSGKTTQSQTKEVTFLGTNNAPDIYEHSPDQSTIEFEESESYEFTILASDADWDLLTYEWFEDSTKIFGATQKTYTLQKNVEGIEENFNLIVKVSDGEGGFASKAWDITILDTVPEIDFNSYDTIITEGESASFQVIASAYDGLADYSWNFGDGEVMDATAQNNVAHTYEESGVFTVTATARDTEGDESSASIQVTVSDVDPNIIELTCDTPITEGEETTCTITAENGNEFDKVDYFEWDFNDGSDPIQTQAMSRSYPFVSSATHEYDQNGGYTITVTVFDEDSSIDQTAFIVVEDTEPIADFEFEPVNPFEHQDVQFTDLSTPGHDEIVEWTWIFDDGTSSQDQNPIKSFDDGTHLITLTVTDSDNSADTIQKNIDVQINAPSVISFTAQPTQGVEALDVDFVCEFEGLDSPFDYEIDFGDATPLETGQTDEGIAQASHTYLADDIYTATCTVYDSDADSDSATIDITVTNNPPEVSFTADVSSGPEELNVEFECEITFGNSPFDYEIDFDDATPIESGQTENSFLTSHSYLNGNYNPTCTITDADGDIISDSTSVLVADSIPENVDFTYEPIEDIEEQTLVQFSGTADAFDEPLTWSWDFDEDGIEDSDEQNPSFFFESDGIYMVTMTVTDSDGSEVSVSKDIDILNNAPEVTITVEPIKGTEPLDIDVQCDISGGNAPYDYELEFGNADGISGQTDQLQFFGVYTYNENGDYVVTCTVTDVDGDIIEASEMIQVIDSVPENVDFTFTDNNDDLIYETEEVFFSSTFDVYDVPVTLQWDFGDETVLEDANVDETHTYATDGLYTITLTVTDSDGSEVSVSKDVEVLNNAPTSTIISDIDSGTEPLEVNFECQASDGNSPYTYEIFYGDENNAEESEIIETDELVAQFTHNYVQDSEEMENEEQAYTSYCKITDVDGDESESELLLITVEDVDPTASFTFDPADPGEGIEVQFTDLSNSYDGIVNWHWEFGDSSSNNEQNPIHVFDSQETYTVSLIVTEEDGDFAEFSQEISISDVVPTAVLDVNPENGEEPLTVDVECGSVGGNGPLDYTLTLKTGFEFNPDNFDLINSDEPIITSYELEEEIYLFTCIVIDNDGDEDIVSMQLEVTDASPNADFTWEPENPNVYEDVLFTATADGYESPFEYSWDWDNDGLEDATTSSATAIFHSGGTHTINLLVTDADGTPEFITHDIEVIPDLTAPVISNLQVIDLTNQSAVLTWETDDPSNSMASYVDNGENKHVTDNNHVVSHSLEITELTSETFYSVDVISCNGDGLCSDSENIDFTTLEVMPLITYFESNTLEGSEPFAFDYECGVANSVPGPYTYTINFDDGSSEIEDSDLKEIDLVHEYILEQNEEDQKLFVPTCTVETQAAQPVTKELEVTVLDSVPENLAFAWNQHSVNLVDTYVYTDFDVAFETTFDAYDTPVTVEWDFDSDGVVDEFGENAVHMFTEPDVYIVTVTITDNNLDTITTNKAIAVVEKVDSPPIVQSVEVFPKIVDLSEYVDVLFLTEVNSYYPLNKFGFEITYPDMTLDVSQANPFSLKQCVFTVPEAENGVGEQFTLPTKDTITDSTIVNVNGIDYTIDMKYVFDDACVFEVNGQAAEIKEGLTDSIIDEFSITVDEVKNEFIQYGNIEVYDLVELEINYGTSVEKLWLPHSVYENDASTFEIEFTGCDEQEICSFNGYVNDDANTYNTQIALGDSETIDGVTITVVDRVVPKINQAFTIYQPTQIGQINVKSLAKNIFEEEDSKSTIMIAYGLESQGEDMVVNLTTMQPIGTEPHTAEFNCSVENGIGPYDYLIDYNDGSNTELVENSDELFNIFTHEYVQQGDYTASCLVTDSEGANAGNVFDVSVSDSTGFDVGFTWDPAFPKETVQSQFFGTTDAYDIPVTWSWDFDNDNAEDSNEQNPIYTFDSVNTYPVTLIVTDSDGSQNSLTQDVVVIENIPQCSDGVDNDGDCLIDMDDPGCSSPDDDDESDEPINATDLRYYPDMFNNNGDFNGLIVVGETAPVEDSISMTKIGSSLEVYGLNNALPGVLDGEVVDSQAQNLIVVGSACNNSIAAELLGVAFPSCGADTGLPENTGVIRLLENGASTALLVTGWTETETSAAADVLAQFTDYQDTCTFIGSEYLIDLAAQTQCSDGADNDGDGLIDFPNDPGCENAADDDENDPASGALDFTIQADPTSGNIPLLVQFTSTIINGTQPYTYAWDFNDDNVTDSTSSSGVYIYNTVGDHTASLTITDGAGDTLTRSTVISTTQTTRDIAVTNLGYSTELITTYLDDNVEVTATITNQGNVDETGIEIGLYINNELANSTTLDLISGASDSVALTFTASTLNNNDVKLKVTPLAGETNLANQELSKNMFVWSVESIISPNTIELFLDTANANVGDSFNAYLPLQNDYNIYAFDDLKVNLVFDENSFTVPIPEQLIDFANGAMEIVQWVITADQAGNYHIDAAIGNNEITSDEIAGKDVQVN
jgi:PKD repeat protein